ncbi:MAG TPA: CopG family transcriptional regulator [Chloroflexota bacterium]|nr:CopG family transcriptional regulator [Chloroflexota bacterium]
MAVEKLSVSIPSRIAQEAKRRAGPNGLSAFVTKSLQRQLEEERRREAMKDWLDEMDELHGPLDPAEVEAARQLFRD